MPITTLADIVRTYAGDRPDDIALVLGDAEVSWSRLYERSRRVATALQAAGVGPQDHVSFLDKNGLEHFEISYGAALLNAIPVDVNWRLAPPEVAFIVNDCESKVLVVGADFVPVLDAIAGDLPAGIQLIVIGGHPDRPDIADYESWVESHADVDPHVPSAPDDTVLQLYSSGTTGRPKGVMLTNDNLLGLLPTGAELWGFDENSVNLVAMPLFHIGGSGWAIAGQFVGARSVILRELDPAQLVHLFATKGITHAFVVPAVLQFLLMTPGAADADYSSLQLIAYGASPISEDVLSRSVALLGCDFTQVYGLTETTGAIVHLPPEDHDLDGPNRHRLRSCGLPGPGVGLRIVNPDTGVDVTTAGEVGEIWVNGPQIMKGYWNNPGATADAIDADGWFRTGDAGYLDADGYVYIHDRVKDMIVSGGENIYPAEVENVLMSHPAVADVAVIGVPDDKWGETPKAIVVLAAGAELTPDELITFARSQLAKFKCPTSVDFTDALPRNPSGKILKKDLRAPFWAGRQRNVN
jgi:long-chain acyl-CoA synthetase